MVNSKDVVLPSKSEYPKMLSTYDGEFIVMFSEVEVGMVISSTVGSTPVGYYADCWDMGDFCVEVESITLYK